MSDLVSVIIPTYNRSHFVTEAIDSVLCQTYPNIELIVVNDGSTDNTEEKLQPYMDRITYIRKENGGLSSAINAALKIAKGKYITRLDDDDLFMPDKIEKQVKVFEENPDVGLVTSGCFKTDAIGRITGVIKAPDISEYGLFLSLLLPHDVVPQPTVMVRRKCHDKVGVYRDTYGEDYEMWLRISRYWKVAAIDEPLAKYRRHSGNMTSDLSKAEKFQQDVKDFTCDTLDNIPLAEIFPALCSTSDPYRESCAYAARGALYLHRELFERSKPDFLKALALSPTNPIPLLWLGISARSQGDFQLAEEYLGRIQEGDELYSMAWNARDMIVAIQKSPDENSSLLWKEIQREFMKLFKITFHGISDGTLEGIPRRSSASNGLKLSHYAIVIDNYPQNGRHLLFNTLTHAMVSIDDDFRAFIHNPDHPVGEAAAKYVGILRKMGVLISRGFDETEMIRKWYSKVRGDMSKIDATILTTYDCNFACKYCIEQGVKQCIYMDDQCSDQLADWLMRQAGENGTELMSLLFYGGEPLLNVEPIYRISERLWRFALEKRIVLSSSITTNGSLLDGQVLQDLTKLGLKSVKVTIDGIEEVHDARRPFKSGKGSFDRIIENIHEIPETVELVIQSNLDLENIGSFPDLLDFFERSGLKNRIDDLVISPIFQSLELNRVPMLQNTDCIEESNSQIDDEMGFMRRLTLERGFSSQSGTVKRRFCRMNRNGAMVIDPLGAVYRCSAFVGRQGFSIGDIYNPEFNQYRDLPADQLEKCFLCAYFPVCGGGCRYKSYMLYGDDARILCEKGFMEDQTRELIKLEYERKKKQITAP